MTTQRCTCTLTLLLITSITLSAMQAPHQLHDEADCQRQKKLASLNAALAKAQLRQGDKMMLRGACRGSVIEMGQGYSIAGDVNAAINSRTALHIAAEEGHVDAVQWLIANGAEINKEDSTGETPLKAAWKGKHLEIIRHLLEKGACCDASMKEFILKTFENKPH